MKVFHCDHCDQLVFFENVQCLGCDRPLAYLPDLGEVGSLDRIQDDLWQSPLEPAAGRTYRLCQNYLEHNVCNWAVPNEDSHTLCLSCRLTHVIPNLDIVGNREAWYRLESAKRRLVYSLLALNLPLRNKAEDPEHGLAFDFLAEVPAETSESKPVLTGHVNGVISISVAEADDVEREKRRVEFHEPYRTLLGHFRHEAGHYYWEQLVSRSSRLEEFRELFGDERADYTGALQRHYEHGAPADWQRNFISAYASSHAWEDWAETWAHYVHMADTLEMAVACGLSLRPPRRGEPSLSALPIEISPDSFRRMTGAWFPLTYVLNNLNRGLGLPDPYPFVLSPAVLKKLEFVHEIVRRSSNS